MLGSAIARPRTCVFGEDAYPDIWTKAAALLHSIIKSHALIDGDERLGWLATASFLEIDGVAARRIANDDVYNIVIEVAASDPSVDQITERLERNSQPGT